MASLSYSSAYLQLGFILLKKCSMLKGTVSGKQQRSPGDLLHVVPLNRQLALKLLNEKNFLKESVSRK
jgi:hypothetical protein